MVGFLSLVDSIRLALEQTQHEPHILVVYTEFFDDDGGLRSASVPDALPEFGQLAFEVECPEKGVRIAIDLCDHTWSEVLVIDPAQVRRSAVIDRVV